MLVADHSYLGRAISDLRLGISSLHLWPMLAWQEIKQRYRRSLLGPFWLTISTAVFIAGMGPLYGTLMGQNTSQYIHFLAVGFIVWQFISSLITESCQTFIAADGLIKQTRLPLTVHAMRVVWRNVLVLAHNFVIIVLVSAYFAPSWNLSLISVPVGIFVIAVNGLWMSLLLGLLSARFRDIPQMIASLVQLLFFLTPIFWRPEMLVTNRWITAWNPAFHLIELVRAPILGSPLPTTSWIFALTFTAVGWIIAIAFFARFRARIAYWL